MFVIFCQVSPFSNLLFVEVMEGFILHYLKGDRPRSCPQTFGSSWPFRDETGYNGSVGPFSGRSAGDPHTGDSIGPGSQGGPGCRKSFGRCSSCPTGTSRCIWGTY